MLQGNSTVEMNAQIQEYDKNLSLKEREIEYLQTENQKVKTQIEDFKLEIERLNDLIQ